jgi:hypothetical protein
MGEAKLRPIFASRWIEINQAMTPMEFQKLFDVVEDNSVIAQVELLLERKLQAKS